MITVGVNNHVIERESQLQDFDDLSGGPTVREQPAAVWWTQYVCGYVNS